MRHLVDCVGSVAVAGFVHVDEAESALEEFLDVRFADEFGSEEFVEFEIGEAAIGDACRQDFEKALGVDRAESADFFEDDALRVIDEFFGIDETAKFYPRDRLTRMEHNRRSRSRSAAMCSIVSVIVIVRDWKSLPPAGHWMRWRLLRYSQVPPVRPRETPGAVLESNFRRAARLFDRIRFRCGCA